MVECSDIDVGEKVTLEKTYEDQAAELVISLTYLTPQMLRVLPCITVRAASVVAAQAFGRPVVLAVARALPIR